MVSFLLRRPFVKLLEIFSISNATVTCQAETRMPCAKAEICLSMCLRCLCNRHLLHRQSGHFVNSSHLLSLISYQKCLPPEPFQRLMCPSRLWHLMFPVLLLDTALWKESRPGSQTHKWRCRKASGGVELTLFYLPPKIRHLIRPSHLGSLYSQWRKTGTSRTWFTPPFLDNYPKIGWIVLQRCLSVCQYDRGDLNN